MEALTAQLAWNILEEYCGATGRDAFIRLVTTEDIEEYRFGGLLGFGGKFWPKQWRVSYYPEDETPEMAEAAHKANEALASLQRFIKGKIQPPCIAEGYLCALLPHPDVLRERIELIELTLSDLRTLLFLSERAHGLSLGGQLVERLPLSIRIRKALVSLGAKTAADVARLTVTDITECKGIGPTGLSRVRQVLLELGLKLEND